MMKTKFYCDSCESEIGEAVHLSISVSQRSGLAVPPSENEKAMRQVTGYGCSNGWKLFRMPDTGKIVHFCTTSCLNAFFIKFWVETLNKIGKKANTANYLEQ